MQLGFVTAILPELSLEDVLSFAATEGFRCVEVMCWPRGKAERRYAGVTHLDVTSFGEHELARTQELIAKYGVQISSLGYYPNPLCADPTERATYADHLHRTGSCQIVRRELEVIRVGLETVDFFCRRSRR